MEVKTQRFFIVMPSIQFLSSLSVQTHGIRRRAQRVAQTRAAGGKQPRKRGSRRKRGGLLVFADPGCTSTTPSLAAACINTLGSPRMLFMLLWRSGMSPWIMFCVIKVAGGVGIVVMAFCEVVQDSPPPVQMLTRSPRFPVILPKHGPLVCTP